MMSLVPAQRSRLARRAVSLAVAGRLAGAAGPCRHLPPLLITDGAVWLPGPVPGTAARRRLRAAALGYAGVAPSGGTLLLYIDGLIERRDRHLDDGLTELLAVAAGVAAAPIGELCGALLSPLVLRPPTTCAAVDSWGGVASPRSTWK